MNRPTPEMVVDITLYSTTQGGRRSPTPAMWFGCPCKLSPNANLAWDARFYFDAPIAPGETRRGVGVIFLSRDSASRFREARRFYLWEGRIIGEAVVAESGQDLANY